MSNKQIKKLDALCSDKLGAKCAGCGHQWRVWYTAECKEIGRIYCKCEKR